MTQNWESTASLKMGSTAGPNHTVSKEKGSDAKSSAYKSFTAAFPEKEAEVLREQSLCWRSAGVGNDPHRKWCHLLTERFQRKLYSQVKCLGGLVQAKKVKLINIWEGRGRWRLEDSWSWSAERARIENAHGIRQGRREETKGKSHEDTDSGKLHRRQQRNIVQRRSQNLQRCHLKQMFRKGMELIVLRAH